MAEEDWEALADSSEALDKVLASNPNLKKHADEDIVPETVPEPLVVAPKPKQVRKVVGEEFDKKQQRAKPKSAQEVALDPIAEKERIRKLEEDADHQIANELFDDIPKVQLRTEESFTLYAQQVASHLSASEVYRAPIFFKELLRAMTQKLTSKHLIDVSQTLTALITEKQKQEKGPTKKVKTNAKVSIKGIGKNGDALDMGGDEDFVDEDDEYGDFM